MSYERYYPNGWQSGQSGGTPITPEALNHIEDGLKQTYSDFAPAVESADYPGCYYRIVDGATEWLNPPMVPGVEYRTTERRNGKEVYTKLITPGTAAYGNIYGFPGCNIWRYVARVGSNVLPFYAIEDTPYCVCEHYYDAARECEAFCLYCSSDFVGQYVSSQIWYTKSD